MNSKIKRDERTASATTSADATETDLIAVDDGVAWEDDNLFSAYASQNTPLEQLEEMERFARLQRALRTVAYESNDMLRAAKGGYIHNIPQYYLN